MTNNGICNQCGTYNTETLRCNCANKTLLDLSPVTPEEREEAFTSAGRYLNDTEIRARLLRTPAVEPKTKGGSTSYYDLPPNPNTLQDLIEHRNMNGSVKDVFKACYRLGQKDGMSDIDDVTVLYKLRRLPVKQFHLDEEKIALKAREREFQRNVRERNAVICETQPPTKPDIEYYKQKRIGTMAADFNRIFGTNNGETETYDLTDSIGVALRAIQELAEIVDEQAAEIAELRAALKLPEKQKKQVSAEFTAEEIEKAADKHVKAAYDNIMQELKQ